MRHDYSKKAPPRPIAKSGTASGRASITATARGRNGVRGTTTGTCTITATARGTRSTRGFAFGAPSPRIEVRGAQTAPRSPEYLANLRRLRDDYELLLTL
jgi:hypothetical protein